MSQKVKMVSVKTLERLWGEDVGTLVTTSIKEFDRCLASREAR
jgi:hypothetical protein